MRARTRERWAGRVGRRTGRGAAVAALLAATAGCTLFRRTVRETPQQLAERTTAETGIRREVEGRLAAEPALAAARVRVAVQGTEVALYGSVPGFGALRCAIANAELASGVTLVVDHLVLDPGPVQVRCLAPRLFAPAA